MTTAKSKTAPKAAAKTDATAPAPAATGPIVNEEALAAAQSALDREAAQREADEAGDTETIELQLVTLNIVRDNTTTQVKVLEHEVPILEALHGEENVNEVGSKTVDVADFDPQNELDTLIRKYGKNGEQAVQLAFPGGAAGLADLLGIKPKLAERDADGKRVRNRNKSGEQAMIVDYADPDSQPADISKVRRIIERRTAKRTTSKR